MDKGRVLLCLLGEITDATDGVDDEVTRLRGRGDVMAERREDNFLFLVLGCTDAATRSVFSCS